MEILYAQQEQKTSKFEKHYSSLKFFVLRYGLLYSFQKVQQNFVYLTLMFCFFLQLYYYVDLKNQDEDFLNKSLSDFLFSIKQINFEFKFDKCQLTKINFTMTTLFILNLFFLIGHIITSAFFVKKNQFEKLFKNKNRKLETFLFFSWLNREVNSYLLYSLHICCLINIISCKKNFQSDALSSQYWIYIFNIISTICNFIILVLNFFFDSLFNVICYDKKFNCTKYSHFVLNLLRIIFACLIYTYHNYGEEQIFEKKKIRLLIFLGFLIIQVISLIIQTFVMQTNQLIFQNMLFVITFISFISLINTYFKQKNLLIFLILLLTLIVYFNRQMFKYFQIKNVQRVYQQIKMSHHIQQKQVLIDKFLKQLYFLYIQQNFNSYENQQIREICFLQVAEEREAFLKFLQMNYNDKNFFKEYFIVNYNHYNYIQISSNHNSFNQLLVQVYYSYVIFQNYQLAYIKLIQYLQNCTSLNQIINLLTLIYEIQNDIELKQIKKLQEYQIITENVLQIYKLSQDYSFKTQNFTEKYQQLWIELAHPDKATQNLQNKLENIVKLKQGQANSFKKLYKKTMQSYRMIYLQGLFQLLILKNKTEFQKFFNMLKEVMKTIIQDSNYIFTFQQRYGLNSNSTVVEASGNLQDLGIIKNVFYNYKDFLGYEKNELLDLNVNIIIPKIVSEKHDLILLQFLKSCKGKFINRDRLVFVVHKNTYIRPVQIFLKMSIHQMYGLRFYLYANIEAPIIKQKFFNQGISNLKNIYYLIFNEKKQISDCSENIQEFFQDKQIMQIFRNLKQGERTVYISDLFPELEDNKQKKEQFYDQQLTFMYMNLEFYKNQVNKLKNQNTFQTITDEPTAQNIKQSSTNFAKQNFIQTQAQLIQKEAYFDGQLQIYYMMFSINDRDYENQLQNQNLKNEIFENDNQENFKQKIQQIQTKQDMQEQQNQEEQYELSKQKFIQNQQKRFQLAIKLVMFGLFFCQVFSTNYAFYTIKTYHNRYLTNITDFFHISGEIIWKLAFQTEIINKIYYGNYYVNNVFDAEIYNKYLEKNLQQFQSNKSNLDKLTENFINLLYNEYDQFREKSDIIKNWKIVYLEDDQILSYEANFIVSLETLNNKIFTISQSPVASFYFTDIENPNQSVVIKYIQQNEINFIYIWTNIFYEYAISYTKLKKEFYDYTYYYMNRKQTKVTIVLAAAIFITIIALIFLFILLQKLQNKTKKIIIQFLNVPETKCEQIIQNCSNFLTTLDYVDKYNINRFDVNDYVYLQDNQKINNKIESFNTHKKKKVFRKKTSLNIPKTSINLKKMKNENKVKKCKFLKLTLFLSVVPIFFTFQLLYQTFGLQKVKYLDILNQLNEYEKTTILNFLVNYHNVINEKVQIKKDLLLYYQNQMQKANSVQENFKKHVDLQDYHFLKFWNNFLLIQDNLCDFAQQNLDQKQIPQDCDQKEKSNIYQQGMEFIVIALYNNSIQNSQLDKENLDKQKYINSIKDYELILGFLATCLQVLFLDLFQAFDDKMNYQLKLKQIFFIVQNFLIVVFTTIGIYQMRKRFFKQKNFNEHLIDLIPKAKIKNLIK